MQDVIFSGTENRKPLSYASVAITLDNSDHQLMIDFEEVTVTRKLYRSGESEYLINGSACRLKDVNELFYDTGIGKEGYSIIGQGQIDKILSGKPEERRELFDEAAGIVKFKRRKNMSVKKLEEERQNLLRVNDILTELEKQVGPLERQAETTREYLKKKEEKQETQVVEQVKIIVPYCLMITVYLVMMSKIGYIASTVLFMIASLIYLKLKNKVVLAVLSVLLTIILYFVFTNFLTVILPQGSWFNIAF